MAVLLLICFDTIINRSHIRKNMPKRRICATCGEFKEPVNEFQQVCTTPSCVQMMLNILVRHVEEITQRYQEEKE